MRVGTSEGLDRAWLNGIGDYLRDQAMQVCFVSSF